LSPADLDRMVLPRPGKDESGYDARQVEAFLARVSEALSGRTPLPVEQVRNVRFEAATGRQAYGARAVDALLQRLADQLGTAGPVPTSLTTGTELLAVVLRKSRRGYDPVEVDAFLTRAAAALDGRLAMRAEEVYRTRFTQTTGLRQGYRTDQVDELLDELERELRGRGR
jgi:DivIVA domain-containing protein